jgi:stage III sporulation protein SpoIIIAA
MKGDCTDTGSRSTQERTERAGRFSRINDVVEEWNHFLAKGLVQMIEECAPELLIVDEAKAAVMVHAFSTIFHRMKTLGPVLATQRRACFVQSRSLE